MTILLDGLLDSPLSPQTEVADAGFTVPATFGASLDGHPIVVDTKQYRRRTTPATRTGQDVSAIPGEQALNNEVYWNRSQQNFTYGVGQKIFDSSDSGVDNLIARQRCEEIWNLDIDDADGIFITDFVEVTQSADLDSTQVANTIIAASSSWGYYIATDLTVKRIVLSNPSPTACTGILSNARQLTTNGVYIYAVTDGAVYFAAVGDTSFASVFASATGHDSIFYSHGYLLSGKGSELYRLNNDASITLHFTQAYDGTWGVNGWASSPEYIYMVWTSATGMTEIYKMSVDSTGLLTTPTVALPSLEGETINCLLWYQGVMLIGTQYGFRVATVDNGNLIPGPLIELNRDKWTFSYGVSQFSVFDGKVWFPYNAIYNERNNNVDEDLRAGTETGVGVIDLGHSVDTLQPSWRQVWRNTDATLGVGLISGSQYLVLATTSELVSLRHDADSSHPVTRGSFSTGWITFGIPYKKTFIDVDIAHDPLTTGQSVEVWLQEEDVEDPVLLGISSSEGATAPTSAYPVGNISSNRIRLIFVLNGDVVTPFFRPTRLRRWMLRAYPMPKRVDEILVPMVLHREVRTMPDEGGTWIYDELAEWQHFSGLAASGEIVFYREGNEVYRVKVDSLEVQPESWTTGEDGGFYFYNSLLMIRLLTLD